MQSGAGLAIGSNNKRASYTDIDGSGAEKSAFPNHQSNAATGGGSGSGRGHSPWLKFGLPLLIAAVIAGAVVGGVVGSRNSGGGNKSSNGQSGSDNGGSDGSDGSPAATGSASMPSVTVSPLPRWDFTSQKMIGMNIGNWLIRERWMDEAAMLSEAGPAAWDEWTFSAILGKEKATKTLQDHWDSWVTEDDIEKLFKAGINHMRIPIGYWVFPNSTTDDEPYVENAGQLERLEKLLGWCYQRKMYIIFDLHGLPGSQDGEQQSGHNTTNIQFYQPAYQTRADATVKSTLDWIADNPYRSVISSIGIANEPRPWSDGDFDVLKGFYERSYDAIQQSKYPVPMVFHHAFPKTNHLQYWLDFVTPRVTDPPSLIIEDHPYPGNFPAQNDAKDIMNQLCNDAKGYIGYPIPVLVTEWSLYTNVTDPGFDKTFYAAQAVAWSWSAGGTYWAMKLIPTPEQLAANLNYTSYSFLSLLDAGVIQSPSQPGLDPYAYLNELGNSTCGTKPEQGSQTYAQAQSSTWVAEASAAATESAPKDAETPSITAKAKVRREWGNPHKRMVL